MSLHTVLAQAGRAEWHKQVSFAAYEEPLYASHHMSFCFLSKFLTGTTSLVTTAEELCSPVLNSSRIPPLSLREYKSSQSAGMLISLCAQLTPHHFQMHHLHLSHLLPLTSCFVQWQPFRCTCMSRSAQQKHPGQESQLCDTAVINDIFNVTGNSTCWNSAYTLTCGGAY